MGQRSQFRRAIIKRATHFALMKPNWCAKVRPIHVFMFKNNKKTWHKQTLPFPFLSSGDTISRIEPLMAQTAPGCLCLCCPQHIKQRWGPSACLGDERKRQWPVLEHHLEATGGLYLIRTRSCMYAEERIYLQLDSPSDVNIFSEC